MRCDVSIEANGGVYRLRAHSALGRAYLASLPSAALVCCTLPCELIVDELPHQISKLLIVWRVVEGGKE